MLVILYVLQFSWYCSSSEAVWSIDQNAQFMRAYNSHAPEPNFTKRGCEDSLDIVVIPVVLVFQNSSSFPHSLHFSKKMDILSFQKFMTGPIFMGVPPLTNNTIPFQ